VGAEKMAYIFFQAVFQTTLMLICGPTGTPWICGSTWRTLPNRMQRWPL